MSLLVRDVIRQGVPIPDASNMYIIVDGKYISGPFSIMIFDDAVCYGEIVGISRVSKMETSSELKELEGRQVSMKIIPGVILGVDFLYFKKESWGLLRDYGVIPNEYEVTIRILELEKKTPMGEIEKYEVFPKREVKSWE